MLDYFHPLTLFGGTWVSSGVCIKSSSTKALSGPSWKMYITWLPSPSMTRSNVHVFLLQIKYVAHLFWSPCCSPGWCRYLYKLTSSRTFSSGYVLYSLTISSLIASFDFISIIDYFVLLIYSANKIFNPYC